MDIIFDIDGTLADASHRLHFITPPAASTTPFKKDWDSFLADEQVAKDAPIPQTFEALHALLRTGNRILFVTGRPATQRDITWDWIADVKCPVRTATAGQIRLRPNRTALYMRTPGDRRPSSEIKRELLHRTRSDGFDPVMVFEDRKDDTAMWRSEGLLCCQVAEGNY